MRSLSLFFIVYIWVTAVGVLGCIEPLEDDAFCAAEAVHCDFDGDGVLNDYDDFPKDASCSVENNQNCGGCGKVCPMYHSCNSDGACVCKGEQCPPKIGESPG